MKWLRNLVVLTLGLTFATVVFKSTFQFINPDIGVETKTEYHGAKFPSLTFCSLFYSNISKEVLQNTNATFADIHLNLPKFTDNAEVTLFQNAMHSSADNPE